MKVSSFATFLSLITAANAFTAPSQSTASATTALYSTETEVSRRNAFAKSATFVGGVAGLVFPSSAFAEVSEETPKTTTRMGGLLVGYYSLCCLSEEFNTILFEIGRKSLTYDS